MKDRMEEREKNGNALRTFFTRTYANSRHRTKRLPIR